MLPGDGPKDLARQRAILEEHQAQRANIKDDGNSPKSHSVDASSLSISQPMTSAELSSSFTLSTPVFVTNMRQTRFHNHLGVILGFDGDQHVKLQLHEQAGKKIRVPRDRVRVSGLSHLPSIPSAQPSRVPTFDAPGTPRFIVALLGSRGFGLPDHVVQEHIAPYFLIRRVATSSVQCKRGSTNRGDNPLSVVCNDFDDQWWISAPGGFSRGCGREWLEFFLGEENCRVSAVGMKIPPLPHGPLAVRHFFVECVKSGEETWSSCSGLLETLDVPHMQRFALSPPVDAMRMRVVMVMSALGSMIERKKLREEEIALAPDDCVGLFGVKFW